MGKILTYGDIKDQGGIVNTAYINNESGIHEPYPGDTKCPASDDWTKRIANFGNPYLESTQRCTDKQTFDGWYWPLYIGVVFLYSQASSTPLNGALKSFSVTFEDGVAYKIDTPTTIGTASKQGYITDPENNQTRAIVFQPLGTDPWILYKVPKLSGGVGVNSPANIVEIKFTARETFGVLIPQILFGVANFSSTNPYIQEVQSLYKASFGQTGLSSLTFKNLEIPTPQMSNAAVYIMLTSNNIFS